MSGLIQKRMLPKRSVGDYVEFERVSVHNAARRAVDEPNPFTRGTIVALVCIDVEIEPVKDVMNLGYDVLPNDIQCEQLKQLADEAIEQGNTFAALGFKALSGVDPDDSVATFSFETIDTFELQKTA